MIPEALPICASRKLELIIPGDLLDDRHHAARVLSRYAGAVPVTSSFPKSCAAFITARFFRISPASMALPYTIPTSVEPV
jgi:hypothetical protein